MKKTNFSLEDREFIELNKLLQILSLVNSGGEAKMYILEGEVLVNSEPCLTVRKKLYTGDEISFGDQLVKIDSSIDETLISILMPVKNAEAWLAECIDSIIAQNENHWELIAVNDHAEDASLSILENYAAKDKRIAVYNNEGHGIIHALRHAYSKSKGQFITRMDADDIMLPEKLSTLRDNLRKAGKGHIAQGQVKYISAEVLGDGYASYEQWLNGLINEARNWEEIYKECCIPSPCWMVYRSDLNNAGAFRPDTYPEDYDLVFRFYAAGLKPLSCSKVLHQWRDYPERTSRTSETYADNTFTELKTLWFKRLNLNEEKTLVLWGAGKKGKAVAAELIYNEVPFQWLTNNPKKIGVNIYGQILQDEKQLEQIENAQVIISLSNKEDKAYALKLMDEKGWNTMEDYFFFC